MSDWSAFVPPHPDGLTLPTCAHDGCDLPAGHDPTTTCHTREGGASWRFFPPPGYMDDACQAEFGCIRPPHEDAWHLHSTGSGTGPHNVWSRA
jgi:hypothetical protein